MRRRSVRGEVRERSRLKFFAELLLVSHEDLALVAAQANALPQLLFLRAQRLGVAAQHQIAANCQPELLGARKRLDDDSLEFRADVLLRDARAARVQLNRAQNRRPPRLPP